MEAHRIGVISDTHGLLRPETADLLKSCEVILHAGDMGTPEVLAGLREIAPVYAVCGNVDGGWAKEQQEGLPEEKELSLFGFRIYMIHNKKNIRESRKGREIVVYGHSHKYEDVCDRKTGARYLNPGSCGPQRFHLPVTMMILTLYPEEHIMKVERIECKGASEREDGLSERDMHRLVKDVIKEVRRGRSVADIAVRKRADAELVENICRMYVTHPGIDIDGIMSRLELRKAAGHILQCILFAFLVFGAAGCGRAADPGSMAWNECSAASESAEGEECADSLDRMALERAEGDIYEGAAVGDAARLTAADGEEIYKSREQDG